MRGHVNGGNTPRTEVSIGSLNSEYPPNAPILALASFSGLQVLILLYRWEGKGLDRTIRNAFRCGTTHDPSITLVMRSFSPSSSGTTLTIAAAYYPDKYCSTDGGYCTGIPSMKHVSSSAADPRTVCILTECLVYCRFHNDNRRNDSWRMI